MDPGIQKREKIIIRTSWISVFGNAILSALKITLGLVSGSLAVVGDGIDSATDIVTSIITLFTARVISRPPDTKFAYGYEKADTVAAKILSFVIFFAGMQLAVSTIRKMWEPLALELPSMLAVYVTVVSIIGKSGLALYQFAKGKQTKSYMLVANAKNMKNDVIISFGVLVGLGFTFLLRLPVLDSITALIISFYIVKVAWEIFKDANTVLMDGIKDPSVYTKIFNAVEQTPGATNPHRVRSRQIGNLHMIVLDIEVDGNLSLYEAHEIANNVESAIRASVEHVYDIVVHIEPAGKAHETEIFGVTPEDID